MGFISTCHELTNKFVKTDKYIPPSINTYLIILIILCGHEEIFILYNIIVLYNMFHCNLDLMIEYNSIPDKYWRVRVAGEISYLFFFFCIR